MTVCLSLVCLEAARVGDVGMRSIKYRPEEPLYQPRHRCSEIRSKYRKSIWHTSVI
jgi:hypothetical protein